MLGASPVANDAVERGAELVREDQAFPEFKIRHALEAAALFRPRWDGELAETLMRDFDLPPGRAIRNSSRFGLVYRHWHSAGLSLSSPGRSSWRS